ncbi:LEA type 2 family protein [Methanocaldococcus infernus]
MKKLLIIFSILALTLFSGCLEKPTVEFKGEKVENLGDLTKVTIDIYVSNPNPLGVKIDELTLDIYALANGDKIKIGEAVKRDISINPGDNNIKIPILINNSRLIEYFIKTKSTKIPVKVEGEIKVNLMLISVPIPISYETEIDIGNLAKEYLKKEAMKNIESIREIMKQNNSINQEEIKKLAEKYNISPDELKQLINK